MRNEVKLPNNNSANTQKEIVNVMMAQTQLTKQIRNSLNEEALSTKLINNMHACTNGFNENKNDNNNDTKILI